MRGHKKFLQKKGICLNTKKYTSPQKKYRYLKWIEGRADHGKECTSIEGKIGQILIRKQDQTNAAQTLQRGKYTYAHRKACVEIKNITVNSNTEMMPELEDLTNEERLKEMHLTTLKERGDLITIYELMNNLEETDRKILILRRKGKVRNVRRHKKKIAKRNLIERYKKFVLPKEV